tara:strand:+ start:6 stop:1493 length:1488 start_codon:yes stop_codon:yes gene_type:complete
MENYNPTVYFCDKSLEPHGSNKHNKAIRQNNLNVSTKYTISNIIPSLKKNKEYSTIKIVWAIILSSIYFTIQTMILYIGLKQQALTKIVIVGMWSMINTCAWLIGNSALGLFKGSLDRLINQNHITRIIVGIIPPFLAASLMTTIYIGEFVVPLVILNMAIGFPCIAASDALADETISNLLTDRRFATIQFISTSVIGKLLFALVTDSILTHGSTVCMFGWIFAIIASMIHVFYIVPNAPVIHINNLKSSSSKITTRYSFGFLLFVPLLLKLWESIFADVPLSSLKWISALMVLNNENIISATTISMVEITTALIVSTLVSWYITTLPFKKLWLKYTQIHAVSTFLRVVFMLIIYYVNPIYKIKSTDSFPVVATYHTSSDKLLEFGMSDNNITLWQGLFFTLVAINSAVDATSSVLMIMLLKNYARNENIRYSVLDGWVRVFTFAAMMPLIKHNRNFSMYSSGGSIVWTLVVGLVIYIGLQMYGLYQQSTYNKKD